MDNDTKMRHVMRLLDRPQPVDLPPVILPPILMKAALESDNEFVRKYAEERCVSFDPDPLANPISRTFGDGSVEVIDAAKFYVDSKAMLESQVDAANKEIARRVERACREAIAKGVGWRVWRSYIENRQDMVTRNWAMHYSIQLLEPAAPVPGSGIVYGPWPKGQIDHIDGNPSNNAIANLRDIPGELNQKNMRKPRNSKSLRVGVRYIEEIKKWQARIQSGGREINLGYYADYEAAVAVRCRAEAQYGFTSRHGK